MIGVLLVVLAIELLNTAIEKLSDHVTPEHNRHIGMIKDFGSAAVFCALWLAGTHLACGCRDTFRIGLSGPARPTGAARRRPDRAAD